MKNLNQFLRATKKETVQVQILENVYDCPADPPAIVAIHMAMIQANPDMPECNVTELISQAVDAVFGEGAFAAWIPWMGVADISRILLFVQYGYNEDLLVELDKKAEPNEMQGNAPLKGEEEQENPPAKAG